MQKIDGLRGELDQIHQELFALLQQRFAVTEKIWQIKQEQNLPFTDLAREEQVFHQFDQQITDEAEKKAVQNILRAIVFENKKYLEAKLK